MSTPAKSLRDQATLPNPQGSYLVVIYPEAPDRQHPPLNWTALSQYRFSVTVAAPSGGNCQITYVTTSVNPTYTASGNNGVFGSFTFTISGQSCVFNNVIVRQNGNAVFIEGDVTIGTVTAHARFLPYNLSLPVAVYNLTSVSSPALDGQLSLQTSGSTYTPANGTAIPISPTFNTGQLSFSANNYDFSALYTPDWRNGHEVPCFRGTAAPTTRFGGDADFTAIADVPEPVGS